MKKTFLSILLCISLNSFSQKYDVSLSRIQYFSYDSSLLMENAIKSNAIEYGEGGTTQSVYLFDIDSSVLIIKRSNGLSYQYKIIKVSSVTSHIMECYVSYPDAIVNYIIMNNPDNIKDLMLLSRYNEGNKVSGWFDLNVKLKNPIKN